MTNPYSMAQENYYPQAYAKQTKTSGPSVLGMTALGAIGGGTVGYFKNRYPVSNDGNVSDFFAKEVFEKNLNSNSSAETKNYFKQLKETLEKIDKVKTPEEFRNLLNANKAVLEDQCKGISSEALLDSITSTNLKSSKLTLKKILENIMDFELTKTKNAIRLGWNVEKKKFVKTSEFRDEKLFDIIKNVKNNVQLKKTLKYGGISAGVLGALTLLYKMFTSSTSTKL